MRKPALVTMALIAGFSLIGVAQQDRKPAGTDLYSVGGTELYKTFCASCHGLDGKGAGPAAAALKHRPSDLTLISKRNGGQFPSFRIEHIIDGTVEGTGVIAAHGTHDMPVWGELLPQHRDEALLKLREHNLTEYVRSIRK